MSGVFIGIDLGTSGLRAVAIDSEARIAANAATRIEMASRRDPDAWWQAFIAALGALSETIDLRETQAIAIDGTSGTILPVDEQGAPLGPASLYNDHADPALVARVEQAAPRDSAARGATSPLARFLAMPRDAILAHETDYLAARLTGQPGITDANNALKSGYDPVLGGWPSWLGDLGVATARLPRVLAPGAPIGPARAAGLPDTVLVVAGTTDGCAAFLATGANQVGDGVTSLGSTITIKLLSDRPITSSRYGVYSHKLLGQWLVGGASNAGGAVLAKQFDARRLAELSAAIDSESVTTLDYYPLPAPGERFPINDPCLAPRMTPRPDDDAAFLHGLLDGLARIEALGYQRLAELGAAPLRGVRTAGGGAGNAAWTRLRARRLGVAMLASASQDAAYGTALLARSAFVHA